MVFFLEEKPEEEGNGGIIAMCGPRTAKPHVLFPVTSQPWPRPAPLSTFISTFTDRREWGYSYFFFLMTDSSMLTI